MDIVLKSVIGHETPVVPLPKLKNPKSNFLEGINFNPDLFILGKRVLKSDYIPIFKVIF